MTTIRWHPWAQPVVFRYGRAIGHLQLVPDGPYVVVCQEKPGDKRRYRKPAFVPNDSPSWWLEGHEIADWLQLATMRWMLEQGKVNA